jgi:hypothetical protein
VFDDFLVFEIDLFVFACLLYVLPVIGLFWFLFDWQLRFWECDVYACMLFDAMPLFSSLFWNCIVFVALACFFVFVVS